MQIYKKRSLGEIISDSLAFFKQNGKNYFKNYLSINGVLFLALILLFVVGFKDIISQLFNSNMGDNTAYFENYFQENPEILIISSVLIFLVYIVLLIVNVSFPVVYLKLYGETNRNDFEVSEIIEAIKEKIGKMFIFILFSIFVMGTISIIVIGINILLVFLVVGVFIFFITFPMLLNVSNFTFYDYMLNDKGIFDSFSYALQTQFSKNFWKYIGCTLLTYILISTVTSIFSTLPLSIIGMIGTVSEDAESVIIVVAIVLYIITIVVSLLASNLLYIVFGFMYFDSREDLHHNEQLKEIDTIGSL